MLMTASTERDGEY